MELACRQAGEAECRETNHRKLTMSPGGTIEISARGLHSAPESFVHALVAYAPPCPCAFDPGRIDIPKSRSIRAYHASSSAAFSATHSSSLIEPRHWRNGTASGPTG